MAMDSQTTTTLRAACRPVLGKGWSAASGTMFDVLLAYVDESYCDDWFYMVASIATAPIHVDRLYVAFERILSEESERLSIDLPREVHGHELFQGRGAWEKVDLHERLAVAGKVLQATQKAGVTFIIRGLDRAAQRRRYRNPFEPYPMILTHVMKQVNVVAQERGVDSMITCDEIHQHDRHRAMLERHRSHGTPGFTRSNLANVVGQLKFVTSESSPMIQAADVVAYLKHRIVSRPNAGRSEARARANLWSIIEPSILQDYCWVP